MNEHLLQFTVDTKVYGSLIKHRLAREEISERYWEILPWYTLSRCPFCGSEYRAQVDTYSIKRWRRALQEGNSVFNERYQTIGCEHFILVHHFINFGGIIPLDAEDFNNNSEVPYVIPRLLLDGHWGTNSDPLTPFAVMHMLPICGVEGDRFVPRYKVYIITYYAQDKKTMRMRYSNLRPYMGFPHPLPSDTDHDYWWDLMAWVKVRKLLWLDSNKPDLPLIRFPAEFPYQNINGIKHGMQYDTHRPPREFRE